MFTSNSSLVLITQYVIRFFCVLFWIHNIFYLKLNAAVQVKMENGEFKDATIQKMNDHSLYTVGKLIICRHVIFHQKALLLKNKWFLFHWKSSICFWDLNFCSFWFLLFSPVSHCWRFIGKADGRLNLKFMVSSCV